MTIFKIFYKPMPDLGDTEEDLRPVNTGAMNSTLELAEARLREITKNRIYRIISCGYIIKEIELDTDKLVKEYHYNRKLELIKG